MIKNNLVAGGGRAMTDDEMFKFYSKKAIEARNAVAPQKLTGISYDTPILDRSKDISRVDDDGHYADIRNNLKSLMVPANNTPTGWTEADMLNFYATGTKPEGVAGQDWELGFNKYTADKQKGYLESNLALQQNTLAGQQKSAQQSASIAYDKLRKYLGQSALASGAATGQVGSNQINANNAYQQNRATINSDFSAQNLAMLDNYAQKQAEIEKELASSNIDVLDKYYARDDANQTKVYQQLLLDLDNGIFNTSAEFRARIEEMKPYMNEQDYKYLSTMSRYLSDNLGQKETDEAYASGTTVETEQEIANKWAAYKQTYKGNEYSGSEPTITSNGYLTVTAGGKQRYAYEEIKATDIKGTNAPILGGGDWDGGKSIEKKVKEWVAAAQTGALPNGAVINIYKGNDKLNYIMYYNGKFYKIKADASNALNNFK